MTFQKTIQGISNNTRCNNNNMASVYYLRNAFSSKSIEIPIIQTAKAQTANPLRYSSISLFLRMILALKAITKSTCRFKQKYNKPHIKVLNHKII